MIKLQYDKHHHNRDGNRWIATGDDAETIADICKCVVNMQIIAGPQLTVAIPITSLIEVLELLHNKRLDVGLFYNQSGTAVDIYSAS